MEPEQHGWASLPKALKTSLLSAAVMLAALVLINLPLQTDSAPQGIVSFQLAVTADQAHDILNSWHSAGTCGHRPLCGWTSCSSPPT